MTEDSVILLHKLISRLLSESEIIISTNEHFHSQIAPLYFNGLGICIDVGEVLLIGTQRTKTISCYNYRK